MKVEENTSTFIRKLQEGDTETWQQFDQQYRQEMVAYLLKMGVSAEDAEDIYHEALVKVLQRIDEFDEKKYFDRWLRRITINQCIDYLRRRRRSPESAWSEDAQNVAADDLDPSVQAQQSELHQRIDAAIASLPFRQKQVAQLRLREEMKFGEIADTIGGNAASLKSLFGKAKKKLQLQLAAYLQAFWLPWHRLKEFALGSATSKSVVLPIALTVSLSCHGLLIYSLRHLPRKPENMFVSTSAIVVTLEGGVGRGRQVRYPPTISGQNRPILKTNSINLTGNSTVASGRTSGEGFSSSLSFTPLRSVALTFPDIQAQAPDTTELPDMTRTQMVFLERTHPNSTRRQGVPLRRDDKALLLPVSQSTTSIAPLQIDESTLPSFLYREAEHPDEIFGFKIEQDAEAFNGGYLVLPGDVEPNNAIASYRFIVAEAQAGDYYLWGRVLSKNLQSDSFRVNVDDADPRYIWDTGVFQRWTWTILVARQGSYSYIGNETPQKIHLNEGEHTLSILGRETDTQLDALLLARPVPTNTEEVIHTLPQHPLPERWMNTDATKEWQLISLNEPPQVFTSYIRFGNTRKDISSTLITWPLRRLKFSGQPLESALFPPYQTYLLSKKPPKRARSQLWLDYSQILTNPTIFCLSFGSRSEAFVVASPVVFLSNESGLLAVQGSVAALGEGFNRSQKRQLYQTLMNGGGRLILLANKQGLPRLRWEVEQIFSRYEWRVLPSSHQLFWYPLKLPESVSINVCIICPHEVESSVFIS